MVAKYLEITKGAAMAPQPRKYLSVSTLMQMIHDSLSAIGTI